jgi:hypothetical protein
MIFCHPKTQLLTTLSMWQGGPLASFRVSFRKKKKKSKIKSCHLDKSGQKLCFGVTIYYI